MTGVLRSHRTGTRDQELDLERRFQRDQTLLREERIRRVAADNMDLSIDDLMERFGEVREAILRILPAGEGRRRMERTRTGGAP